MFITPSFGGNMHRKKCTTTYYKEANEKVWFLEQEHRRERPAYISWFSIVLGGDSIVFTDIFIVLNISVF